jgi:hypothetical protein
MGEISPRFAFEHRFLLFIWFAKVPNCAFIDAIFY